MCCCGSNDLLIADYDKPFNYKPLQIAGAVILGVVGVAAAVAAVTLFAPVAVPVLTAGLISAGAALGAGTTVTGIVTSVLAAACLAGAAVCTYKVWPEKSKIPSYEEIWNQ